MTGSTHLRAVRRVRTPRHGHRPRGGARLSHSAIGVEHLLLGVAIQDPILLGVGADRITNEIVARLGAGQEPSPLSLPLTAAATAALELCVEEALSRPRPCASGAPPARAVARKRWDPLNRRITWKDHRGDHRTCGRRFSAIPVESACRYSRSAAPGAPSDRDARRRAPGGRTRPFQHRRPGPSRRAGGQWQARKLLRTHGLDEQAVRRLVPGLS